MIEYINDVELSKITAGTKIPYIVKKGDTLSALAELFHCTVEDICEWNKIKDPNVINVGDILTIKF